jgi:hypothetical protein
VIVNYRGMRLAGSVVVGSLFALMPTLLLWVIANRKARVLVVFFPLAILLTRMVLWGWERSSKEDADFARKRYKSGRPPYGQ